MVNSNISSTRLSQYDEHRLTAEIGWRVWAPQQISTGFRVLGLLLHQRRSAEVNQTLHDIGSFLGWYTIYTFWGLLTPNGILPGTKLTLRPSVYWQRYCTTFEQWASAELCGMGQGNSTGWLSHGILPCHIINFSYYLDRLSQWIAQKA